MCKTYHSSDERQREMFSGIGSRPSSGAIGRHSRLERGGVILAQARSERSIMLDIGALMNAPARLTAHFWPSSGEDSDGPTVTLSLEFGPNSMDRAAAQHLFGALGSTGMVELRFRDSTKI